MFSAAFMGVTASVQRASIGLMVDLHKSSAHQQCNVLNPNIVQHVIAAKWASEVISNQSRPRGTDIDIRLFDTCSDKDVTMRDVFYAIKSALDPQEKVPLIGLIGLGDAAVMGETVSALHAFDIPLVLASPRLAEVVTPKGNILTTAPDISSIVKPTIVLAEELGVTELSLVSSCKHSIKIFEKTAAQSGIEVKRILQIDRTSKLLGETVRKFVEDTESSEALCLILEPPEIAVLAEYLRGYKVKKSLLITGTIGLNKNLVKVWRNVFSNSYLVEPHMPKLPDFRNYFLNQLEDEVRNNSNGVIREYIAHVYNCSWNNETLMKPCFFVKFTDLDVSPEVMFVVKAVSAFSAALMLVSAEQMKNSESLQHAVLTTLSQLSPSLAAGPSSPHELSGTSHSLTSDGHLVSNKYIILHVGKVGDLTAVGWYSSERGLSLDWTPPGPSKVSTKYVMMRDKYGRGMELNAQDLYTGDGVNVRRVIPEHLPWATVIVAFAAVGVLVTLFMLTYVLIKMCDGTLAGNQSLGIILLLCILTLYSSVVIFTQPPTEFRCSLRIFVYPVALSLCYAILLVKVMQLRSLVLLGLGGRISYLNQYLILFFMVLVQLVIGIQWFLSNQPLMKTTFDGARSCFIPKTDFLLLHSYIAILALLAFCYGLSVLKIHRNYKEGRWVTLASGLTLPVLCTWGVIRGLAANKYQDPTICIALVVLATILVIALFLPKISTIAKQSSHFKHKKMNSVKCVTPVYTTFMELHSQAVTKVPSCSSSVPSYCDNVTQNPIYQVTNGAYP